MFQNGLEGGSRTKRKAELAPGIALEFAKNRIVSLDPLSGDLREDLRRFPHVEHLQGPADYYSLERKMREIMCRRFMECDGHHQIFMPFRVRTNELST